MKASSWLRSSLRKLFGSKNRPIQKRNDKQYFRPGLEVMEDRLAPAVNAVQVGDTLNITLALSDHAFVSFDGTNVRVDNATAGGTQAGSFSGINHINVSDAGVFAGQQVTFAQGTTFTQNITVTGIETANVFQRINGTASGNAGTVNVSTAGEIQDAIGFAATSAIVSAAAGTYVETVNINKSVTLQGANAAVAGTGTRGAESIIRANGNVNTILRVSANNVTIRGFTIDGDDPTLVGGALKSGADSNALHAISNHNPVTQISGLTVQNNIIKNVSVGVRIEGNGSAASTGHLVTSNWFDSIGNLNFGYAVNLRTSAYADVTNNLMTRVWTGIHTAGNFNLAGPTNWTVSGNEIRSYASGFDYWLQFGSASPVIIDNNDFIAETGAVANNFGLLMVSVQNTVGVTFTNNTIVGTDYGIGLTNVSTSNVITFGATNSISGTKIAGVYLTDNLTFNPVGSTDLTSNPYPDPIAVNITGMSITNVTGIGVKVEASRTLAPDVQTTVTIGGGTVISGTAGTIGVDVEGALARATISGATISNFTTGILDNGGTLSFGAGVTISGGTTGLSISGVSSAIVGNTLNNLAFIGQGGAYIVLANGALDNQTINATAVTFGGLSGATATLAQNFLIEDRITHATDNATLGFIRVKASNVFVTTASGSIQRGVDAAAATDIVNVSAGVFAEQVVINKSLTVQGAGDATVIRPTSAAQLTAIYTTGVQNGAFFNNVALAGIISVSGVGAANVNLRNLKVDGELVTSLPAGAQQVAGIVYGETGGTVDDVTVEDMNRIVPDTVRTFGMWFDAVGGTDVTVNVTDSTIRLYGRNGINARGDAMTIVIDDNVITGPGMAGPNQVPNGVLLISGAGGEVTNNTISANHYTGSSFLGSGILLFSAASGVLIDGNEIFDTDDAVLLNSTIDVTVQNNNLHNNFKGVQIEAGTASASITNNFITNNTYGIYVETTAGSGNFAFNNSITGSTTLGVSNVSAFNFDASTNYWGVTTAAGVAAQVTTGNVDFSPWFNLGTEDPADGLDVGFQGDFSSLSVDDNSIQVAPIGRIAEAIDLLSNGSLTGGNRLLRIHAGVYAENLDTTSKALTLDLGDGPTQVTINSNVIFNGDDTIRFDIAGTMPGGGHDQLVVNGTVNLGGATLFLNDTLTNPITLNAALKLIENNDVDPITGTFNITYPAPVNAPSDGIARIVVNGHTYQVFYNFGTAPGNGNDFVLRLDGPLFQDSFNQANGTFMGAGWTEVVGDFTISGQQLVGSQSANLAVVTGLNLTDAIVQADVTLAATGNQFAGVVARYQGSGVANMYWGGLYRINGTVFAQIYRNLGGSWTLLSSQAVPASNATLRFEVLNDSLKLYVNGVLAGFAIDSFLAAGGSAGLWASQNSILDNFTLNPHPALVNTSLTFADAFTQNDGTELSAFWRERLGSYAVVNNALVGLGAANLATVNGINAADVTVQADVTLNASGDHFAGLVARYQGSGVANMYFGALYRLNGTVFAQIYRNLGGVWTLLSSQAVNVSSATLRFEVVGNLLQLFVNNTLVVDAFDNTLASGTVGLWSSQGTTFDTFSASAHAALATTFTESFTQTNGTTLSASWMLRAGAFTATGNQMQSTTGANLATVVGMSMADVVVQADVTLNASGNQFAGLVARYQGSGVANMYFGGLYRINGTVFAQIYRNLGGSWTLLSSQAVATSSGTLRFEVIGNSLQLYLNGTLVVDAYDSTITTAGTAGLWASQALFDNFSVNPHPGLVTTFSDSFTLSNGSSLSTPWRNRLGNFTVQGTAAVGATAANLSTVTTILQADTIVQADVTLNASGDHFAGLVARYQGSGVANMYFGGLYRINGTVFAQIYRNLGGGWTLLNSRAVNTSSGTLRFEVIGNSLQLFLNNDLVVDAFDSTITTAGAVGLWSSQGNTFDNFSVVPHPALPTTFSDSFTQGNGTSLSADWTTRSGSYTAQSSAMLAGGAANLATVNDILQADTVVQATVALNNTGSFHWAGVVSRYTGTGIAGNVANMYFGGLLRNGSTTFAQIYVNINGNWTSLSSQQVNVTSGIVRLEVINDSLKLFLNGDLVGFANDSSLSGTGAVGIWASQGSTVDTFSVVPRAPLTNVMLPFSDDFILSNGSQLSANWRDRAGSFTIQSNRAVGIGATNLATLNGVLATDVTAQANIIFTGANQSAGLVARYSGSGDSNMYLGMLTFLGGNNYVATIHVNVNGTWTQLASVQLTSFSGQLAFQAVGSNLRLLVDGALVLNVFDSSITGPGAVGMRVSTGVQVENFSAS